jgi:FkbM family methyltransferase
VGKLARAQEAWYILRRHAGNLASWCAIISAYASTLRSATDQTPLDLVLRINGRQFPVRMRKSDIYTVAEIFHEKQYALESSLPDKPVVIDAGANIGISALWFLGQNPGARLVCFEPGSGNFDLLTHNLGRYADVTLEQAAIGLEEGELMLNLSGHGAMHSVKEAENTVGSEPTRAVRLDRYLADAGIEHVDLLKLDVEGSELDALHGLGDRLGDVDVIAGEMHEDLVDDAEFYGFLDAHGFELVQKTRFDSSAADRVHMFEVRRR